ncbi:MAG: hypothetical protein Q8M93_15565 [Polaromonas sp.]|nr:hypothetical protein [Polaromonas sp.]MDP2449880.1 hypothetical protein [Polaromonas sp.]MDP3248368.1 hypothetical protein [Polaromonas sp.]MDP3750835.1 hypothetical protein [Polaromonas sp.]MDP3827984.1 hypothetical protein [Polaromonas sp.]
MDSILDSLTWAEELEPGRKVRRWRHVWLKRLFVLVAVVAALGVLMVP